MVSDWLFLIAKSDLESKVLAILICIRINAVLRTVHVSKYWSYSMCFIDVIDKLTEFDMKDFA